MKMFDEVPVFSLVSLPRVQMLQPMEPGTTLFCARRIKLEVNTYVFASQTKILHPVKRYKTHFCILFTAFFPRKFCILVNLEQGYAFGASWKCFRL